MRTRVRSFLGLAFAVVLTGGIVGCDGEPDTVGEHLEETIDQIGEAGEDLTDEATDAAEDVAEDAADGVEDLGEEVDGQVGGGGPTS